MNRLYVYMDDAYLGDFIQLDSGRHAFQYADSWFKAGNGLPLSLSMPLDLPYHEGPVVTHFFDGLLPDNEAVRKRWARQFEVSYKNPFSLLTHMGKDCPGALQICTDHPYTEMGYDPLTVDDIEDRLRTLREDETAWRKPGDQGQFSLAGAQRKTALHYDGENWSLPTGRAATTHILKPPIPGFEAQEANECFCLWLSSAMGLVTTHCDVMQFGAESAVVVKRFDRYRNEDGLLHRIHMEDLCQAFGISPELKYQTDGGPNAEKILELLAGNSDPDSDQLRFMQALFFNWLVLGTDAHAKNYSLLLGKGKEVVLAPLYDISSYLPYTDNAIRENLAMKVISKKQAGEVSRQYWERLATRGNMHVANTMAALDHMVDIFEIAVRATEEKALLVDMNPEFIKRLSNQLIEWLDVIKRQMK